MNREAKRESTQHAEKVEEQHGLTVPDSPTNREPDIRFSKSEKWFIVTFAAFVGFFSPFTSNIYYPAIPTMSNAFHKSTELINLTVTMYMVFQGVAPMVWGPLSDNIGRRPISAVCLLVLTLSCIGLALTPTNAFWLLMLLRCLQAAGSASTIAVGAGIIGDISTRAERGGFFGLFTVGPMIGPAIGPVIGGALTGRLGWRSMFWFLAISASICFILIVLFQPETLRKLLDSGRDTIPIVYKPLIPLLGVKDAVPVSVNLTAPTVSRNPFCIFLHLDVDALMAVNALCNTVFYGVLASVSSLFAQYYPFLTEIDIGLCFLGIGVGMAIGSTVMGKILDFEYRRLKVTMDTRASPEAQHEIFPIEKARFRLLPIHIITLAVCSAGYGWSLERHANLAVPLILQTIAGFVSISIMNASTTLMIDLLPDQSSSVTACSNFARCTIAAVLVSTIDLILRAIGPGWTYVIHAGLALLMIPFVVLSIRYGPRFRKRRQLHV